MNEIIEFVEDNGFYLIEDAAQALGAEYGGRKIGTFGDVSILSFGLGKIITGGSGGALVINNNELLEDAKIIREKLSNSKFSTRMNASENIIIMKLLSNSHIYSIIREPINTYLEDTDRQIVKHIKNNSIGFNPIKKEYIPHRIHPLSAKIINYQLERMQEFNKKRIFNAKILTETLNNQKMVQIPSEKYFENNIFCRYALKLNISVHQRNALLEKLIKCGIDSEKPYFILKDLLSTFKQVPNSINLADTLFTLPNSPCLSPDDVTLIGNVTKSILNRED
jgi:dTDP-4-amino-4,6-dideoxygalactose transaminase